MDPHKAHRPKISWARHAQLPPGWSERPAAMSLTRRVSIDGEVNARVQEIATRFLQKSESLEIDYELIAVLESTVAGTKQ